jgi:hypothetical protein
MPNYYYTKGIVRKNINEFKSDEEMITKGFYKIYDCGGCITELSF